MLSGSSVSSRLRTCIGVTEDTFRFGYLKKRNENNKRRNLQIREITQSRSDKQCNAIPGVRVQRIRSVISVQIFRSSLSK